MLDNAVLRWISYIVLLAISCIPTISTYTSAATHQTQRQETINKPPIDFLYYNNTPLLRSLPTNLSINQSTPQSRTVNTHAKKHLSILRLHEIRKRLRLLEHWVSVAVVVAIIVVVVVVVSVILRTDVLHLVDRAALWAALDGALAGHLRGEVR